MANQKEIVVRDVDVNLLRTQRDWLVTQVRDNNDCPEADGIINLLDYMLDVAEGYIDPKTGLTKYVP